MNNAINSMVESLPKDSVQINYCDTNGMLVLTANKCHISGFNSLEVQSANSTQLQPVQALYEDEVTPVQVIQPAMVDNELQHMKNSWFIQGTEWGYEVTYNPSIAEDVVFNGARAVYNGNI
jgi:hypothetical protein